MMIRLVIMGLMLASTVNAQGVHSGVLSGSAVLSGQRESFWGELAYPAAMEKVGAVVGVFGEKRYLTDFHYFELGASAPVGGHPVQLRVAREGNPAYSDLCATISLGQKINDEFSVALRAGYNMTQAKGYPARGNAVAGFGVLFRVSERFRWALQADGINSFFSGDGQQYFAVRTGFGYRVSDLAALSIELVKENQYPVFSVAGFSYSFTDRVTTNIGYSLTLGSFLFGVGFKHAGAEVLLNTSYHNALGASAGISFVYRFKPAE